MSLYYIAVVVVVEEADRASVILLTSMVQEKDIQRYKFCPNFIKD